MAMLPTVGMTPIVVLSTCLLAIAIGAFIWIFDPILHILKPNSSTRCNDEDNILSSNTAMSIENSQLIIEVDPTLTLTLVVPAYNEEDRLSKMLDSALLFLSKWTSDKKSPVSYEIIIVDDKSKDRTRDVVVRYIRAHPGLIRLLSLERNHGKGGAVKQGVRRARGKYILMVDADGATEISDLEPLFKRLQEIEKPIECKSLVGSFGVVIGSRAHMEQESISQRAWYRTILMRGFHALVVLLCTSRVRDTQCGFKLFTRAAARFLFSNLHLERWAFDIELIYLAEVFQIPIAEVAVHWQEIAGSKLIQSKWDIVTTSLTMARDMFCVRVAYLMGIWKTK